MASDDPDTFMATVDDWIKQTTERQLGVFREATKKVVRQAQTGVPHIPVDTGFARASVRASLESMPLIDPSMSAPNIKGRVPRSGEIYPYDDADVVLTIASASLDETIYIGWTANYVVYLEYGHSQQAPSGFVRLAAEQWPQTVSQTVDELKARAA
jgi:hypothetical protein